MLGAEQIIEVVDTAIMHFQLKEMEFKNITFDSAMASIYSPSVTVGNDDFSVSMGTEIGSFGVGYSVSTGGFEISFGFIFGFSIEISWD